MHITIFRRRFTPWGVDGTMVIDGFFSTCTVENPHIINSIYFRSIIKENDFNGKDQDRIYSNNYHSRW